MTEHKGKPAAPGAGKMDWKQPALEGVESATTDYGKEKHQKESPAKYEALHDHESESESATAAKKVHKHPDSFVTSKSTGYVTESTHQSVKVKKTHHAKHHHSHHAHHGHQLAPAGQWGCQRPPLWCEPQYVVRDHYIKRELPIIHPVVTVNRYIYVDVPKHYYQTVNQSLVVDSVT